MSNRTPKQQLAWDRMIDSVSQASRLGTGNPGMLQAPYCPLGHALFLEGISYTEALEDGYGIAINLLGIVSPELIFKLSDNMSFEGFPPSQVADALVWADADPVRSNLLRKCLKHGRNRRSLDYV